jgi:hypothetical protein
MQEEERWGKHFIVNVFLYLIRQTKFEESLKQKFYATLSSQADAATKG